MAGMGAVGTMGGTVVAVGTVNEPSPVNAKPESADYDIRH